MGFKYCCKQMEKFVNRFVLKSKIGMYFKLEARKSSFTTELRAATATFLTMAYIISVNAAIMTDSGGVCPISDCSVSATSPDCKFTANTNYRNCLSKTKKDFVVATIVSSMIGSFAMGIFANLPLGLAPLMGPNAYLTYNFVGLHGSGPISYKTAMAVVLVEGCMFLVVAVFGLGAKLARVIPRSVGLASTFVIGYYIFILQPHRRSFLQQGVDLDPLGPVPSGPDPSMLFRVTPCSKIDPVTRECIEGLSHTFKIGLVGFLITCFCLMKNMKGSIVSGIVFVTLVSWIRNTSVTYFPYTPIGDTNFNYFTKILDFHQIKSTVGAISFTDFNTTGVWVALVSLLWVHVVATTSTLYTMTELAGFVDERGFFEGEYAAYIVNAGSTIIGSALGVSPIVTFMESSSGIKEGGRTGLTAVIIGFYFLLSLFFTPLLTSVPPWAVRPSLLIVGVMMMKAIKKINWHDREEEAAAWITIILMPLTHAIADGTIGVVGILVSVMMLIPFMISFWFYKMRKIVASEQNQVSSSSVLEII